MRCDRLASVKRFWLLFALCVFASTANAQSSSVGLRLSASLIFNVVYTYNFESHSSGAAIRAYVGATAIPSGNGAFGAIGGGIDGIYRAPLGGTSSAYFGLGASAVYVNNGNNSPNIPSTYPGGLLYFLAGIEVGLGSNLALTFDLQPLNYSITPFFNNLSTIPLVALSLIYRF
jgi:hypothetical protein